MTPRTQAGQSLLRQWSGHVNEPEVRIVVLAIEAEAQSLINTDDAYKRSESAKRWATSARATAAVPADAWQAGYEACWNRLKDAGRLLPSDGATAAVPLDVERLAAAMHCVPRFIRRYDRYGGGETHFLSMRELAAEIATEYERLSRE